MSKGIRAIRKQADKVEKELRDFLEENIESKTYFVCPVCDKTSEWIVMIIDHLLDDHKWIDVIRKIKKQEVRD